MEDSETVAPLLGEKKNEPDIEIIQPKWKYVIEPFIFFSSFFVMPMYLSYGQYILMRVAEKYNESSDTSLNKNSSSCGLVNKSSPEFILQQKIQAETSYLTMEFTIVYSVAAILSTLWLGSVSDKRGRRYPLLMTSVGGFLNTAAYTVVVVFNLDVRYFFIGQLLGGLTGGWESLLVACFAYIADTTTPKERAFRIVLLEMALFINASYLSIVTGYLIRYVGFLWIFAIVSFGKLMSVLYIILLVPETIKPKKKSRLCSTDHLKHSFRIFRTVSLDRNRNSKLLCLYVAFFFTSLVSLTSNVNTLFQMNSPLCWNSVDIGYYTCAYVGIGAIGGTVAGKILTKYMRDALLALLAALAELTKYMYMAFCVTTLMMYFVPVFGILAILLMPMLRALVSKAVDVNEQGAALSFLAILQILCSCFGNALFHTVYSETLYIMSGFVYIAAGCTLSVTVIILCFYLYKTRGGEHPVMEKQTSIN